MINETDIEAFKDAEVADAVVNRVMRGVTKGREIHANETIPFVRAFVRQTNLLAAMLPIMDELKRFKDEAIAASAASMKMYDRNNRETD